MSTGQGQVTGKGVTQGEAVAREGDEAIVREALIDARYPLGGHPDPFNPQEDQTPYEAMAAAVVAALSAAGTFA